MKVKITTDRVSREQLLKRIFFMLYSACGGPAGMGFLQARKDATEEDVWKNVTTGADYPGDRGEQEFARGQVYGDYVFGRMMKWGVKLDPEKNSFTIHKEEFDPEYQGFARTYRSNEAILDAAMKSFDVEEGYAVEKVKEEE